MLVLAPYHRAVLTDDLVGSSAVSLGAAVYVVSHISISHTEGARGKGNRVSTLSWMLLCCSDVLWPVLSESVSGGYASLNSTARSLSFSLVVTVISGLISMHGDHSCVPQIRCTIAVSTD